jgi:hypothetical protein
LFALSVANKMKAPHPPGSIPHRGYSDISLEKVYNPKEVAENTANSDVGSELRKISDFKVSCASLTVTRYSTLTAS